MRIQIAVAMSPNSLFSEIPSINVLEEEEEEASVAPKQANKISTLM